MTLILCLFAGADQASAADSISGTSYNFGPTDYSRGEAHVVKTSLPPAPAPAPAPTGPTNILWALGPIGFVIVVVLVVGPLVLIL
jgi:hypothetical protein